MWDYISSKPAIGALRCQWCVRLAHASADLLCSSGSVPRRSGFRQPAPNVASSPGTMGSSLPLRTGAKRRKQIAGVIPHAPFQHHRPERGILLREKVKAVTTGAQPRGGQLVLSRLAVQQRNQGLSRGRRLNRGAGHDLPRADGLPVEALVSVTVRVERGAVE